MPASHACLIIVVAAAAGWAFATMLLFFLFRPQLPRKFFGFTIWGILPSMQDHFARAIANGIAARYLQPAFIEPYLQNQQLLERLKPEIEKHVDLFLAEKLPEIFPLLAKMMGEKTLSKFKAAFLTEVEVIFPVLIKSYSGKILSGLDAEKLVKKEIAVNFIPLLQDLFTRKLRKQLLLFKVVATALGALAGVLQWLLVNLLT